jgi:DNA-binding transcriptional LysR family regulator
VELTDAGRVFVEEARSALSHTERAVHFARAAHEGSDSIFRLGTRPMPITTGFPPCLRSASPCIRGSPFDSRLSLPWIQSIVSLPAK